MAHDRQLAPTTYLKLGRSHMNSKAKTKSQPSTKAPVPVSADPPAPAQVQKPTNERRLHDLVRLVVDTADAKGWDAEAVAQDLKNFKYATIAVSRMAPNTTQEVTGTFEVTCDERVKIAYHQTSFHSWGLSDLYDAIGNEFWRLPWIQKKTENPGDNTARSLSDVALLERLLRRFHRSVRQLKHRHADRPSLVVRDEYDVQDLLHAILRGLFDDIRSEEYTPSYAGGASRMDFLLKSEQIVIETKVASASLRDKQVGEQLMIDIQRYQSHPDCKRLLCFVYDPGGEIKNPAGLETDLTRVHDKLEVKVIVLSP